MGNGRIGSEQFGKGRGPLWGFAKDVEFPLVGFFAGFFQRCLAGYGGVGCVEFPMSSGCRCFFAGLGEEVSVFSVLFRVGIGSSVIYVEWYLTARSSLCLCLCMGLAVGLFGFEAETFSLSRVGASIAIAIASNVDVANWGRRLVGILIGIGIVMGPQAP